MKTFRAGGRDWRVSLSVGAFSEIEDTTGLDLTRVVFDGGALVDAVSASPKKIVEAIWIVCEEQAVQAGISPEQFAKLFGPEEYDAATQALMDGAVDFFPKARGREALRKMLPRAMEKMERQANEFIEQKMSELFDSAGSSQEQSA